MLFLISFLSMAKLVSEYIIAHRALIYSSIVNKGAELFVSSRRYNRILAFKQAEGALLEEEIYHWHNTKFSQGVRA